MGIFDHFRRPGADRDQVAIEIDLAAGVLQECPVCRGVTDPMLDDRLAAAELLAHQRFDQGDTSVAMFSGDRDDLLRRLRSVRERFDHHCLCQQGG